MTVITFRQLQRLTVKELTAMIPIAVTVNGREEFLIVLTDRTIDSQGSDSQKDTIQEKVAVSNIPRKIRKINKNGLCEHFIAVTGYCRKCNE